MIKSFFKYLLIALIACFLILSVFIFYASGKNTLMIDSHGMRVYQEAGLEPAPTRLTIMTYNIGYASGDKNNRGSILSREEVIQNLDAMVREISKNKPDILALQEVDFESQRTFEINQMDYLAQKLGYPFAAYVITWNKRYIAWPYWPPRKHFKKMVSGQVLLSRIPIISQQLTRFEKPEENPFWYNWFYLDRYVQKITLELSGKKLHVWHAHLEAFQPKTRLNQAKIMAHEILLTSSPYKLALGDFNSVSQIKESLVAEQKKTLEDNGEALKIILDQTKLINAESKDQILLTMPSWDPIKKIDHILLGPAFDLIRAGTLNSLRASDHLAVWVEAEIN